MPSGMQIPGFPSFPDLPDDDGESGFTTTTGSTSSKAMCETRATSSSLSISQDTYQEAWENLASYTCGGPGDEQYVEATAAGVAFAIAESFAEVSTFCTAEGDAEARAEGYALAEARAEAIAEGIASIFAVTEICDDCLTALDLFVSVSKTLVVEAVAEAWTEIYVFSDKGSEAVSDLSVVTSHVIEEAVAEVLVNLAASVRSGFDGGCSADAFAEVQVSDFFAECFISNSAEGYTAETDAVAQAGASAAAYACDGDIAEAQVDVIASATASAMAEAIAAADLYCAAEAGPTAVACGLSEANVNKVAQAQAEAFAETFAEAQDCDCDVSVSADASVWAEIWVEAAANAYAEACVEGSGVIVIGDFKEAMEERVLIATARAIASAVADGECRVSGDVCARTSPQCAASNTQCGGDGFEYVVPCCSESYRCIRKDATESRCLHKSFPTLPGWDGSVMDCTLPSR